MKNVTEFPTIYKELPHCKYKVTRKSIIARGIASRSPRDQTCGRLLLSSCYISNTAFTTIAFLRRVLRFIINASKREE
jgi:hypothetical protein